MSVYVDNMQADFGNMKMCHMIADSTEELLSMCDKIGVQRKWIQKPNTANEHFDICLSKRKIALANGAIEISLRELARRVEQRKLYAVQRGSDSCGLG